MNALPAPAILAALAAVAALPISIAAGGTLLLIAGLGCVIHADYVQRRNRVRLPRRPGATMPNTSDSRISFAAEQRPLAA